MVHFTHGRILLCPAARRKRAGHPVLCGSMAGGTRSIWSAARWVSRRCWGPTGSKTVRPGCP